MTPLLALALGLLILGAGVAAWRLRRFAPPGTALLDEETAQRPAVDAAALAAARARVSSLVPDAVLSDALLDASPQQLTRLLAAVPGEVMAGALGHGAGRPGEQVVQSPATAQDFAQLRGLGNAVDELDIWAFGETAKGA